MEKYIGIGTFNEYLGIQNLISERIFKYIDKSKKGLLTKNDFCVGLYQIFFGNLSELIKFTFFICDFNEDGKIYKSDMKLILSYIPKSFYPKYSNQQEYIKEINQIIEDFFNELKKDNISPDEIDYNLYMYKVNDSINDNIINGAFYFFINLIKYIFINKPFNIEVIQSVNCLKNKHLLKVSLPKVQNVKLNNPLEKKSFNRSEMFYGRNNSDKNLLKLGRKTEKKYTDYKKNESIKNMNKILQKDLFSTKNTLSIFDVEQKSKKNNDNLKEEFLGSNKKEKYILKPDFNTILDTKNRTIKKNASVGRLNSGKKILYSNKKLHFTNQKNNIKIQKFQKNNVENKTSYNGFNCQSNKNVLPAINNFSQKNIKQNLLNLNVKMPSIKLKSKLSSKECTLLKESKLTEELNKLNLEESFGCYLYKYSEEDYHVNFKKYYGVINKKEILFFSSNLKNELCTIWYCNNTVISIKKKTTFNKCIYYPITIIHRNKEMSFLLFEEKETQIEFGKQLKMNIDNTNFEDKYETKETIGEGNFAVVKKCIEKKSGKIYAVKIISKNKLSKKDFDLINHEKNYMKLIKHPNIVSLIDDFEDEKYIYFIMEYYKGGDLYSFIYEHKKSEKNINEKTISKIIKTIAQSIQYLQYFGIVHRDLKPENVVFASKDDFSSLAIIDLGVAITLPYGAKSKEQVGTLDFTSPEVFTNKPYDHKVDIWSIGIILYILLTAGRIYPFDCNSKDKKERDQIIGKKIVFLQQEYPDEFFGNKSKYLINLIDKTLEKSPDKRITIDEFLSNYWLVNNSK
jgi:tRNA A-37 threonylcarbamoyl transferase component Bud32